MDLTTAKVRKWFFISTPLRLATAVFLVLKTLQPIHHDANHLQRYNLRLLDLQHAK
jgi:hypothetical protein